MKHPAARVLGVLVGISFLCSLAMAAQPAPDAARGKQLFQHICTPCHAPGSPEGRNQFAGTESLKNKYKGAVPAALEARQDLPVALIEFVVRNGTVTMPPFRKTEISDSELHDIAAYLSKTPK